MAGFDAFTGTVDDKPTSFDLKNPNRQTPSQQSLNQAQWFIGVSGSAGNSLGVSFDAPNWLNVQHGIHATWSQEAGAFAYPQDSQLRLRASGSIKASK
jgi:hypothetical protein